MNNSDLIKKYALSYLSKYHSTKKNLERMLINKMIRMKNLETSEKNNLYKIINQVLENLESNNIINDEYFATKKIISLSQIGKSEVFIRNTLLKKGINKKTIDILLENFEKNNSDWKIESGEKFARKNRLGKYSDKKNKQKDLAKMARAGFNYQITLKVLGYD